MSVINELLTHDKISDIVLKQVQRYAERTDPLTPAEVNSLERLAKIYAILMTQVRENTKAGLFEKLSEDDRLKLQRLGE